MEVRKASPWKNAARESQQSWLGYLHSSWMIGKYGQNKLLITEADVSEIINLIHAIT